MNSDEDQDVGRYWPHMWQPRLYNITFMTFILTSILNIISIINAQLKNILEVGRQGAHFASMF